MVSNLDSDPVTVVPRMLLSQLGSSEESHPGSTIWTMLTSGMMMKDGRMQRSTLSVILILKAMRCKEVTSTSVLLNGQFCCGHS